MTFYRILPQVHHILSRLIPFYHMLSHVCHMLSGLITFQTFGDESSKGSRVAHLFLPSDPRASLKGFLVPQTRNRDAHVKDEGCT